MKARLGIEGQANIDFVIAITVFVAAVFFAVQFVSSTASPFLDTGSEKTIEAYGGSDRLVHHALKDSDSRQGELNLSYFLNSSNKVKNETAVTEDLNLDANGIYLTVTEPDTGDKVELYGQNITVGGNVPDSGSRVSGVTRVGYTETNGTVLVKLRTW
jgi:hypothetical protein